MIWKTITMMTLSAFMVTANASSRPPILDEVSDKIHLLYQEKIRMEKQGIIQEGIMGCPLFSESMTMVNSWAFMVVDMETRDPTKRHNQLPLEIRSEMLERVKHGFEDSLRRAQAQLMACIE